MIADGEKVIKARRNLSKASSQNKCRMRNPIQIRKVPAIVKYRVCVCRREAPKELFLSYHQISKSKRGWICVSDAKFLAKSAKDGAPLVKD
jgi:hypothetical protein